jgi:phage tail-like protein
MSLLQKISAPINVDSGKELKPPEFSMAEIPIPIYQFAVSIEGTTVLLFQNVSGMSVSREVEPLSVGGENNYGREFPGHVSYGHVTFEVGLSSSDFFWKWMTGGEYHGYAIPKNITLEQRRPQPDPSKLDPTDPESIFEVVKRWNFNNAFPVSWKISDLGIDNSQNIVIETLELSFDFFELA